MLALLVASAGAGIAATRLPVNSVGTAQLQKGAVTGDKVKDRTLLATDFKRGQLVGTAGPAGLTGAKGDPGPKGDPGAKGDTGPRGPSWGDSAGVFSSSSMTYTPLGFTVNLPVSTSPKSKSKFFVFGRIDIKVTCGPTTPCNVDCQLAAGGAFVPTTSFNVGGNANQVVQDHATVFGTVSLAGGPVASISTKTPTLTWTCRSTAIKGSTTGTYVGAIQLGS